MLLNIIINKDIRKVTLYKVFCTDCGAHYLIGWLAMGIPKSEENCPVCCGHNLEVIDIKEEDIKWIKQ